MAIVDNFAGVAAAMKALRSDPEEPRVIALTSHTLSQKARVTLRDLRIEATMQKIYGRVSHLPDVPIKNTAYLVYQINDEPALPILAERVDD